VLFFELFPAFVAGVVLFVGVVLFAIDRRAQNDPDDEELPRTPSQPILADDRVTPSVPRSSRPSMRA
jgi:hypothetical protein